MRREVQLSFLLDSWERCLANVKVNRELVKAPTSTNTSSKQYTAYQRDGWSG